MSEFYSVPGPVCPTEELSQAHTLVFGFKLSQMPSRVEQGHKPMNICMLREKRPVEPAGFVILGVSIVIPALCASRFVSHQHHRHAHREHVDGQKVLHLSISELLHR